MIKLCASDPYRIRSFPGTRGRSPSHSGICGANVSKVVSEIKVPSNVDFGASRESQKSRSAAVHRGADPYAAVLRGARRRRPEP